MERLVRKAQRGDKNAFMDLIEKNQLALYRAAKAILHREEDVEDAGAGDHLQGLLQAE